MKKSLSSILFTDLHINEFNLEICNDFLEYLLNFLNKNNTKYLYFLGDLFDNRKGLSEIVINFSIHFFEKLLSNKNISIFLIPGNHDKFIETSKESYLNIFPYLDKERIFVKKTVDWIANSHIGYYFFSLF